MSFCTKCGRPRSHGVRFCTGCGAELPEQAAAEAQAPQPPPPRPQPPPRSQAGRKTAGLVAAAVVIALAGGGGAYALVSSRHTSDTTADRPPTSPAARTAPASIATTQPPAASPEPTGSPVPTATTAAPSQSPGAVAVAPAAASNLAEPGVEALLDSYFQAINTRNYTEWASIHDGAATGSAASFYSGYATTQDSGETLTGISSTGGELAATVSFTSHQNPADSVDHQSSCNDWSLTLYLAPQGNGYVIVVPPPGYEPTYTDC